MIDRLENPIYRNGFADVWHISTWVAHFIAPVTPKAFVHTVGAQFGANLEAVSLHMGAEWQSQAGGLFDLNGSLQNKKINYKSLLIEMHGKNEMKNLQKWIFITKYFINTQKEPYVGKKI